MTKYKEIHNAIHEAIDIVELFLKLEILTIEEKIRNLKRINTTTFADQVYEEYTQGTEISKKDIINCINQVILD